jgi:hypothetical protein
MLDEALLRPGRLEVHVEIGLPDEQGRLQILKVPPCHMHAHPQACTWDGMHACMHAVQPLRRPPPFCLSDRRASAHLPVMNICLPCSIWGAWHMLLSRCAHACNVMTHAVYS